MFNKIRPLLVVLVLSLSIFVVPSSAGAAPKHHHPVAIHQVVHKPVIAPKPLVSPTQMKNWSWVGHCETNDNWTLHGYTYSGALGITNANWIWFGGGRFAQNAGDATPEEQAYIAQKILIYIHQPMPDQPIGTCTGSW